MGLFKDIAGIATGILGSVFGANEQNQAAEGSSEAQLQASREGIAENRRQFDAAVKIQAPFVQAGQQGVTGMLDLVGMGGPEAEAAAIARLESSPQFESLTRQGEEAILANASATGGLRGGNTQAALAQFRPDILSGLIDRQFSRLGGLSQLGQASAAQTASAGLQTGANVSNLLLEGGQAQAQGMLARGQNQAGLIGDIGSGIGQIIGKAF